MNGRCPADTWYGYRPMPVTQRKGRRLDIDPFARPAVDEARPAVALILSRRRDQFGKIQPADMICILQIRRLRTRAVMLIKTPS